MMSSIFTMVSICWHQLRIPSCIVMFTCFIWSAHMVIKLRKKICSSHSFTNLDRGDSIINSRHLCWNPCRKSMRNGKINFNEGRNCKCSFLIRAKSFEITPSNLFLRLFGKARHFGRFLNIVDECVNKFVIKCFWLFKCISMNAHLMITSVLSITNLSFERVLTSLSHCTACSLCLPS